MSRKIKNLFDKINVQAVLIIFTAGAVVIFSSYVLSSSGLFNDGTNNLFYMLYNDGFSFYETSRRWFHILYQLPVYLFIKWTSLSSLSLLTKFYSFGLIWIHILSLIGCYIILPKNKKQWIFFPFFSFFIGPVNALSISVSVALSVCSYVWLTAFVIYYSDLSCKMHKALFFIIPLPLLLSHEMMSYMAWPLIILCWHKTKEAQCYFSKGLIVFIMIFLVITSAVQFYMLLGHSEIYKTNRIYILMESLFQLRFLFNYNFEQINIPLFASLLILFLSFVTLYRGVVAKKILTAGGLVFLLIYGFIIFNTSSLFIDWDHIRIYPPTVALPLTGLLWWLYERKNLDIAQAPKAFFLSCVFCILALLFFRIYADQSFYKHREEVSYKIHKNRGVIVYEPQIRDCFNNIYLADKIYFSNWNIFEISLFYPEIRSVQTVLSPSFALCMGGYKYENKSLSEFLSKCEELQQNHRLFFYENFEKLKRIRFFDFSRLEYYIENNISESKTCEL